MRVLIAGCGYVGTELARRLVAAGHTVHALSRTGRNPIPGAVTVTADVLEPESLRGLPAGLDVVFYTVAAGGTSEGAYEAAHVQGPTTLLGILAQRGERPRRVVYTSSTGVYRRGNGDWVDEATPPEPTEPTARQLLEGERAVLAGPFPATVVRLAGIYGPGRTRTLEAVKSGAMAVTAGPPEFMNRIHRDDCAGVLAHVASLASPASVYLGVDCEPAERNEVIRFLAAELGVQPAVASAPEPARSGPGTGSNRRCSNARLLATGYHFAYPTFREGYRALIGT
jgi:nucleoside-diphosphate-sugar epimerase